MTLRESNLKVGDLFRFKDYKTVWKIERIVQRGAIIANHTDPADPHKTLVEWFLIIEPVSTDTPMKLKVYYAHCINLYNTSQEARDVGDLFYLGFEVVNPNMPEHQDGYKKYGMPYFEKFSIICSAVAFRALPDGSIPAGVAAEIQWFRDKSKPIFELPSSILRRVITREQTREYLVEIGHR